ncbi:CDP-glucose 4,6-dehydratase [Rhizobium sp. CFBP 8762]|uniref:CDP-glucose 4,6-dehydratase n=1 Tax=Rhizobium sp. CFBP 8762 TaxID=2775279 RepID=UPI001784C90F|nr:CDP-glucose 4,6-dehydratase [Rhizobium sp. CFBP 8762]MBD8555576.1 CDP-glucose 4,6-dehydratase [Rhizobium sp. CFBP 8762]
MTVPAEHERASWWRGKKVFLTGHTGFKGSWLSLWLTHWGAEVTGLSLTPPTQPSHFDEAGIAKRMKSLVGDIRDADVVKQAMMEAEPEIVLHLGAQALVRKSYINPTETYATNVMGTVHVLEAVRATPSVKAVVAVTSDKCYENSEWPWGYRENDPMGGHDPYSSSKGACELVIASWRKSFFTAPDAPQVASVRAGNVIGGGDWAEDRLIPDILRAFEQSQPVIVRNPSATRPWQHVLEPIGAYLRIAEHLYEEGSAWAEGWNFACDPDDIRSVGYIVDRMVELYGGDARWELEKDAQAHEAHSLALDCSKARQRLGWRPTWRLDRTLERIVDWSHRRRAGENVGSLSESEIDLFLADMAARNQ